MDEKLETDTTVTPQESLVIRFATHADLAKIAHIARITWNVTYSGTIAAENRRDFLERAYQPDNLASAIDVPGHWFYVVEFEGDLIGFGHFLRRYHRTRAQAELVRLYVLPDYQNLGVGTLILRTGFAALAEAGVEQCFVSVQETNALARKFYERHGFVYHRKHGQFLGTQIVVLVQYVRPITQTDTRPLDS